MAEALRRPGEVRAGFLEGSTYPDGTSLPMVAAVNEFGSPERNIPMRPFFRNMVAASKARWPEQLEKVLVAADYDSRKALARMGMLIQGQIQKSIIDTNLPPNAPRTLDRKHGTKPLVDTGHMLASVSFEVVDRENSP
jgi:hypothetical protein